MPLLALPLVQPDLPACLHQRCLRRRVCGLQAVPEGGVLRASESMGSVCLQRRQLPDQRREVAGRVPGYVLRVLWAHLRQPIPLPENR